MPGKYCAKSICDQINAWRSTAAAARSRRRSIGPIYVSPEKPGLRAREATSRFH